MEVKRTQNKFRVLFQRIVEPNYVMNNYYADGIINKISNCSDPEIIEISNTPVILEYLIESLNHLDTIHKTVQVFLIRTLSVFSREEMYFIKIFSRHGDKIHQGFKEINSPNISPSQKVALLEVALRIVKHNSGVSWLLETGVWKEILSLCNHKQTVFVVRPTYKFMAEFLWKLNDQLDTDNIRLVLKEVLKPLDKNFIAKETMRDEEEEEAVQTIVPVLHILMAVLNTEERIYKYTPLIDIIVKENNINSHCYVITDRVRNEEFVLLLSKVSIWATFSRLFLTKPLVPSVQFTKHDLLDVNVIYFNYILFISQRRNVNLVLDVCIACHMIFWKISKNKEFIWSPEVKMMLNQILFMCIVPLMKFIVRSNDTIKDPKVVEYIERIMNLSCEHTTKGLYALRSLVEEMDLMQVVVQSVKKLSSIRNYLNDEQANIVFQALFYVLRDFDHIDDYGNLKPNVEAVQYESDDTKMLIMTYIMDMVLCLLKQHKINWSESFEVICLYSIAFTILQKPNLTTKFVVACLNVITMTVKLFLPPNLTLLLETQPGSTLDQLGTLIYRKMHDLSWEVRDSALEMLLVCTEISFIKFPPFQKQILDNNLINVAAALAFNDYESYVQASALKCLGAASKVGPIWEELKTKYPEIQDQITTVLRNNQEGIVRKEACNVLCEIYQNLKLSPEFKQSLYDHMASTALCDFHWEVQINALKFWKIVFQSLLNDQGMLDGVFPPVTFSKETRKIVTLNDEEIQRRIIKILDELASVGLFTVLIKLLQDDSEIEVVDHTLSLSHNILDVLNKYKVTNLLKPKPGELESEEGLIFEIKEDEDYQMLEDIPVGMPSSDNVIDGIINADDLNLLANIYESHMTLQNTKMNEVKGSVKPKLKLMKYASPYMFVKFLKSKDFKNMIDEKRKWNEGIRSLSSLLDDVLGIYEVNEEINSLDCY